MRPIVADGVAWSVCLSVGRYVTVLSPAKTAEPIEISFGVWTQVDPKKPRIRWGSGSPMRRGNFDGETLSVIQMAG